ncbi:hypothetical protein ADICYQ_5282 [Cyclobacterium qasimii M12-11B]|uniref:Uncharacterized protein n=1 Tax=Cyclobacterium qasimii M12-11B TaxID=641524 RepID=S7WNF2_9BACT|nr:hypothetical protein ADICYQ_5282 [Cyclobacterium qasimii M12-11B]
MLVWIKWKKCCTFVIPKAGNEKRKSHLESSQKIKSNKFLQS